jgi:hypothetical protein
LVDQHNHSVLAYDGQYHENAVKFDSDENILRIHSHIWPGTGVRQSKDDKVAAEEERPRMKVQLTVVVTNPALFASTYDADHVILVGKMWGLKNHVTGKPTSLVVLANSIRPARANELFVDSKWIANTFIIHGVTGSFMDAFADVRSTLIRPPQQESVPSTTTPSTAIDHTKEIDKALYVMEHTRKAQEFVKQVQANVNDIASSSSSSSIRNFALMAATAAPVKPITWTTTTASSPVAVSV